MSKPWTALAPIRAIVPGGRVMALGGWYTGSEQGFGGNEPWPVDDPEAPRSPTRLLDSLLRLEQADLQAWVHGLAQAHSRHGHPWYHQLDYANTDTLLSHLAACLDAAHLARFTRMAIREQDLSRWSEHLARSASDSDRLDLLIALVDRGTCGEIVPPSHPEPCALCAPLVGRLLGSLHGRTHALDTALQAMLPLPGASAQSVAMVRAMLTALLPPYTPVRTQADSGGVLRQVLEACATASDAPAKATLWALAIPVAAQGAALTDLAPAFTRMLTSQTCAIVNALARQHPGAQALALYLHTLRAQQRSHEIRLIHHQLYQGDGRYPPEEYLHHCDRHGAYPHATALGYYLGAWAVATGSTLSEPPAGTTGPLHPLTQPIGRTPQVAHQGDLWLAGSAYAALAPPQIADEDKFLAAPVWQRGGPKAAFWTAYQCVLQAHCVALSPLLPATYPATRGGTEPAVGTPYVP